MSEVHVAKIAAELKLMHKQVRATALLFDEGATIPFIAHGTERKPRAVWTRLPLALSVIV